MSDDFIRFQVGSASDAMNHSVNNAIAILTEARGAANAIADPMERATALAAVGTGFARLAHALVIPDANEEKAKAGR